MRKIEPCSVVKVTQICDQCGGVYEFTGEVQMTYPAAYVHRCPACGNVSLFNMQYPAFEYQPTGEEIITHDEIVDIE